MKRSLSKLFLITIATVSAFAEDNNLAAKLMVEYRLPEFPEEKIYLIPRRIKFTGDDNLVALCVEIDVVCALKSSIFFRKAQAQSSYAFVSIKRDGKTIMESGRGTESEPIDRCDFAFIESVLVNGRPVLRDASVYKAQFIVKFKKRERISRWLTNENVKSGRISIRLLAPFSAYLVDERRWIKSDSVEIVTDGTNE